MQTEPKRPQTNPNLAEIDDPQTRSKLEGMQEVADDFGKQVLALSAKMEQKKGIVAAAKVINHTINLEIAPIQQQVDNATIEPEIAKVRIQEISRIMQIVEGVRAANEADIVKIKGQIEGVQLATTAMKKRFDGEVAKHERWKRIEEEEEAAEQDLRGIPEGENEEDAEQGDDGVAEEEDDTQDDEGNEDEEEGASEEDDGGK